jgi:protein-S-isoprenylcysteine O-methyltransferase Ste14
MNLNQSMVSHGRRLFRWRSYLPFLLVIIAAIGYARFSYPLHSHLLDEICDMLCLAIALVGLTMRVLTVGFVPRGTSGRNTRRMKAPVLNTTGMYSLVRHPLYVANFIIFFSFLVMLHEPLLMLSGALIYWAYYERIMLAEEEFLRDQFGERFEAWARQTRAILPRWRNWKSPSLGFCWRTAVRREYSTLFLIVAVLCAMEVAGRAVVEHRLSIEWLWVALLTGAAALYATVRLIKHHSSWLMNPGR